MKLKLQARYSLSIALLTIAVTVVLAALLLYQFDAAQNRMAESNIAMTEDALIAQMKKRGEVVATTLAENLVDPFYYYDLEDIGRLMNSTLDQKDVRYAYLYDTEGTIVHDGDVDEIKSDLKLGDSKSIEITTEKGALLTQMQGDVLAVSTPIWIGESPLGGVKIGLSLDGVRDDIERLRAKHAQITREELEKNLRTLVMTTLMLIVLAVALAITMARSLIRPIRRLSEFARQVGQQNYLVDEPADRKDELGDLIRSFGKMSQDLQETTISKEHYEGIINNMNEMLLVLAPDERVVATNVAAQKMTGAKPDELVGKSARSLFAGTGQARWDAWIKKIRNADRPAQEEFQLASGSDNETIVSVSGSVMKDSTNNIRNIVCVLRDITDQVKFHEKLRAEKEKAIKASQAKSDFMARMSHEIRTPMNGILGMNQLLLGTDLSARQRHFANRIEQSGHLLLDVINDILDISKIEAGKMTISEAPFDLYEILEKLVDLLGENACSKELELGYFCSSAVPAKVRGDSARLQQVLFNLVGNAIKFTEQGEVLLRVTSPSGTEERPVVRFEVIDSGIGISSSDRRKIFEKFVQIDGSLTREFGGTGLGLSITRQLVEMMGGKIGFDSQPRKGSTFWFELPLTKETDHSPQSEKVSDISSMLVVHKNARIRHLICEQVAEWGVSCVSEEHLLPESIRAIATAGVVLLELDTENRSELSAVAKLTGLPEFNHLHFVALVGMNQVIEPNELTGFNISRTLQKPLRMSSLRQLFQEDTGPSTARAGQGAESLAASSGTLNATANRILLVEDNPVNQEVTLLMLEQLGLRADLAKNGREAVEAFSQTEYSLVLMDIQMPVMNGFEATEKIRQMEGARPGAARIPIIAQTAYLVDENLKDPLISGMDDKLGKPFNLRQLSKVLERWLPSSNSMIEEAATSVQLKQALEKDSMAVLDPEAFEQVRVLCTGNSTITVEGMIRLYIDDAEELLSDLGRAIGENNCKTVRSITHQLRSSSALVGALNFSKMISRLNEVARNDKLNEASDLLASIEKEFARVKGELSEKAGWQ